MRPEQNLNQAFGSRQEQPRKHHPLIALSQRLRGGSHGLKGTELAVAWALATYLNQDGTDAFPSQKRLSKDAGVSIKAVRYALALLCDGSLPLFARRRHRRGITHYSLVYSPAKFVAARDQVRAELRRKRQLAELQAKYGGRRRRLSPGKTDSKTSGSNVLDLVASVARSMDTRKVTPMHQRIAAKCPDCSQFRVWHPDKNQWFDYSDETQLHPHQGGG